MIYNSSKYVILFFYYVVLKVLADIAIEINGSKSMFKKCLPQLFYPQLFYPIPDKIHKCLR